MWLIVGLGNPGAKYLMHRHNIGFMALDHFSRGVGGLPFKEERKALVAKFKLDGEEVLFAKPQTFMNKSGEAVRAILDFYKIPLEKLVVLHDEIDIPFGAIKLQKNRGPGGHNGLRSINEIMGTQDYVRLKLGVGRPSHPKMDVADHVLQNFAPEEQAVLPEFLSVAGDTIESMVFDGLDKTASRFNRAHYAQPPGGPKQPGEAKKNDKKEGL